MGKVKGTIGILTGGGDCPGLNPAIRGITVRGVREGYRVVGIRRGWAGLVEINRDNGADNSHCFLELDPEVATRAARTGGTFLHTSRTRPSHLPKGSVPPHLQDKYTDASNDLTEEVLKNLEFLGIDIVVPIGGDDTLSYGQHLHEQNVPVVAIPKTMDNDVPGTEYCIGFSTCVTRTIELVNQLRTSAGSHERFLVVEAFGRYAGYTALLPAMGGAGDRCMIPEYDADPHLLTSLLVEDYNHNPSHYAVVLVSEGAKFTGESEMAFESGEADQYGHRKLGGIGIHVAKRLRDLSAEHNQGKRIDVLYQKLGYMVRCGNPDAMDSIVPMAYGNMAMDLISQNKSGLLIAIRKGLYDSVPISVVVGKKKLIDVDKYYHSERLRPRYQSFAGSPLFIMAGGQ
jgi:6-phosphofructokinase 1